jgi:hypothetical protein
VIRRWAGVVVPRGGQVLVREGAEFYAILPDREKALGRLEEGWISLTTHRETPLGMHYDIEVLSEDDPRAIDLRRKEAQGESGD